jgi:DNA-binding NtrC family response regulator
VDEGLRPRPLRVLVVDDDPDIALMLDVVVRAQGCDLTGTAADADEARVIDLRDHADVAVLDYAMRGTDGVAFAEELKGINPDTFVILFSAKPVGAAVLANPAIDQFLRKTDVERLPGLLETIANDRGLGIST